MPSVIREGKRIANAGQRFGDSVGDALRDLFKRPEAAATAFVKRTAARTDARLLAEEARLEVDAMRRAAEIPVEASNGFLKSLFVAPFKLAAKIVEQPIALAMKPVRWTLNGGAQLFSHFPKAAPIALILGGAVAGGSWFANRQSKELQSQGEAIAQMQAMQAQASAGQPMQSYMNSASQADVDARMAFDRAQGVAGSPAGSKAEAVMAARQPVNAPETANIAAL
jgi:hypothetical protein